MPLPLPPFANLLASGLEVPESSPAPAPLPALNLPMSQPGLPTAAPMAGLAQMAPPAMASEPSSGSSVGSLISQIAPLLLATVAGRKNPLMGAALISGMANGALAARRERMAEEEHQADLRKLQFQFQRQVLADVSRFDDPVQRQQYLELAKQVGVETLGMSPSAIAAIPVPATKATDVLRKELQTRLADFDKRYAQEANTPAESQLSFKLSNGQTISVANARALLGQAVYNAKGEQAQPAAKPPKLDDFQTYFQSVREDWKAQHGGQDPSPGVLRQLYLQAKSDIAGATKDPALADLDRQIKQLRVQTLQNGLTGGGGAPAGGLSPEGVDYAATMLRLTGKMPPMGMGKTPDRARIINGAAQQAKALRQTPAQAIQRQAMFHADAASLNKIRVLATTAQAAESKALGQLDLIRELSQQVPRSQSPLINKWILAGKTDIGGDPNATALANAILTFTNEYGKIVEGSSGSISGSTDSARKAAGTLISARMNPAQLQRVLDLMAREMRLTIQGYDVVTNEISGRMSESPRQPVPAPDVPGQAVPSGSGFTVGRFTVQVGG